MALALERRLRHTIRFDCGGRIRTCELVIQSHGFIPTETTPHFASMPIAEFITMLPDARQTGPCRRKERDSNPQGFAARPTSNRMPSPIGLPFRVSIQQFRSCGICLLIDVCLQEPSRQPEQPMRSHKETVTENNATSKKNCGVQHPGLSRFFPNTTRRESLFQNDAHTEFASFPATTERLGAWDFPCSLVCHATGSRAKPLLGSHLLTLIRTRRGGAVRSLSDRLAANAGL